MRKKLTRPTKRTTNTLDKMKLQSFGHPSKPHFGSSLGIPFTHIICLFSLIWKSGNSSLGVDTKEPTCCIVIDDPFDAVCMEKTEKFPSAFPFSSMKTYAKML